MKKIFFSFPIALFLSFFSFSQKKQLTIDDAVIGAYKTMYAHQLYQTNWRTASQFTYIKNNQLFQQSIANANEQNVLNVQDIIKITNDTNLKKIKTFPDYEWESENILWIKAYNKFFQIDVKEKKLLSKIFCPDTAENFDLNITKKMVAYTIKNNLFVITSEGNTIILGSDTTEGITYGKSVHRNEFGINKGTFWSNTGNFMAFYRMDETMVTNYPLVDINTRIATTKNIRYPMAGMKSHEVTIGIYNNNNGKIIYLKTGEPKEQYLTNISWSLDDKYILVAVLNREQNHLKMNVYNPETGEFIKTLFEEKNEKYVEPLTPAVFINNTQFLWQSQRDGYNHFYLYDLEGNLIKQITNGNWVVTKYLGIDSKKQWIYFAAAFPTALERNIMKANLKTGEIKRISQEEGSHEAIFNKDFNYWIDRYESIKNPFMYKLLNNEGKLVRIVQDSNNTLKDYELATLEIVTIKAADGKTDLYGRIIKPSDFDSKKKYPLILYVYGGPHAQLVQNEWLGGAALWDYYMAQKGYIVATLDNRGSAYRGFDFESCIHRQMGINEAEDQMEFIKYLIKQGYIDENRIGVYGWSYGGFMTLTLMTRYPEVFKVGVAGGPVTDWKYYEIMYGERYMDTPQENPEGYEKTSLLNSTKNLKGKVLIIHGYMDDVVVLQHSLAFIENCIKNGILLDFFIYPNHTHNVRGKDRIHLMKKVSEYFLLNIKP
jgi:dipeptidyl-peptidase-4